MNYLRHLPDIARGFFHAGDVFQRAEARQRARLDIDTSASLNAVDDDRNADRTRDCFVVLVQSFLGGLVVVGRDGEDAVGAHALERTGEFDHLARVVTPGAGGYNT